MLRETVKEINKELLAKGIFGGKDLSSEFPEMGQCALYCVTEIHTKTDIDKLIMALKKSFILNGFGRKEGKI